MGHFCAKPVTVNPNRAVMRVSQNWQLNQSQGGTALPDDAAIKGRGAPARFPARFPPSHPGFGLVLGAAGKHMTYASLTGPAYTRNPRML